MSVKNSQIIGNKSLSMKSPLSIFLLSALFIGTVGVVMQIGGISWDITSHGLGAPETFFTPPHGVVYTGIVLVAIASALSGIFLLRNKEFRKRTFATGFKLMIIGICIDFVAGPSDFKWHETFGIDGLLSPPHLMLITGMLLSSIGITIALARIKNYFPSKNSSTINILLVFAFGALWFTCTWFINWFTLPYIFQNGHTFSFVLNPTLASAIATVSTPVVSSILFIAASKTIGRFGAASAVAVVVVVINTLANIVSTGHMITPILPAYILAATIPAVFADLVLNKLRILRGKVESIIISGAIIGSAFYLIGFPILVWTLAQPFSNASFQSHTNIIPAFLNTLPIVLVISLVSGSALGVIGSIISTKLVPRRPGP